MKSLHFLPLLLCALSWLTPGSLPAAQQDLPVPPGSSTFGSSITVLPNGNFVVSDPEYDAPGPVPNVGAVYLYDGRTRQIISRLTGSAPGDLVGEGLPGIVMLRNGNFLVCSSDWGGGKGAVTWVNSVTGLTGVVSAANSMVGNYQGRKVGALELSNGNYLALVGRGVTLGRGTSGVTGEVSAATSLMLPIGDQSLNLSVALPDGNYLICSPRWENSTGAVTWGNGMTGVTGEISEANSLVGSTAGDLVGSPRQDNWKSPVHLLSNGNYVLYSLYWNLSRGAMTWGSSATGVKGKISAANSLIDIPEAYLTPLSNGNYVVSSPAWNGKRGAVTWGNGTTGVAGEISASNSLIGTLPGDQVGWFPPSYLDDYPGLFGIVPLSNGNFVAVSQFWNKSQGAVTWVNGTTGIQGEISAANSLIGGGRGEAGSGGVYPLTNGNYVVSSLESRYATYVDGGSVTWGSGTAGVSGVVSSANSLIGTSASNAPEGFGHPNYQAPRIVPLNNGNYVVSNPFWNKHRGAVVWGDGVKGTKGGISDQTALVGGGDYTNGTDGITALSNGNYLVRSPIWNSRGAITWCSGAGPVSGEISGSNSLTGTNAGDLTGCTVTPLSNGGFVLSSPNWNAKKGAVTRGSGTEAVTGEISSLNSLTGTTAGDQLGSGRKEVTDGVVLLSNGNYVINSPNWNAKRGTVTLIRGTAGTSGEISAANSLVGTEADEQLGAERIEFLSNGNLLVSSPRWSGNKGAVTWVSGTDGVTGMISALNSLVGDSTYIIPNNGAKGVTDGNYIVTGLKAITLGDGKTGLRGPVSPENSILGSGKSVTAYDAPGSRLIAAFPAVNQVSLFGYTSAMEVSGNHLPVPSGDAAPSRDNHTDFGFAASGGGTVIYNFTISNTNLGVLNLTGTPKVAVTGAHAGEFTVTGQPAAAIPLDGATAFQITFAPAATGVRTAEVSIVSDDSQVSPWHFAIQGTGSAAGTSIIENWRLTWFGNGAANTGNLEDFDNDGVSNLLEFAMDTTPASGSSGPSPLEYSGPATGGGILVATGQPVLMPDDGGFLGLHVRRKDYASAGLSYTPQFSSDLSVWTHSTAVPEVLADDGINQIVSIPCPPVSDSGTLQFFRVRVTLNP